MKKSQLRKIIRESVKELMTEQIIGCPTPGCTNYVPTAIGCFGISGLTSCCQGCGSGGQSTVNCVNGTCTPIQGLNGTFPDMAACQTSGCGGGGPQQPKRVWFKPCHNYQGPAVTIDRTKKMTIDNQTPTPGKVFKIDLGPQDGFYNPAMNGAFVPMRVITAGIAFQPNRFGALFGQPLDFDKSNCKTQIPNDPITYAKVAQGGGENGYINKTKR